MGLALPRVLARLPHEDDCEDDSRNSLVWFNAAYLMAGNVVRAVRKYRWCSRFSGVESGGVVESIPTHTFPTADGGVDPKCPIEICVADRNDVELARAGDMPLAHRKGVDFAAFLGAQSFARPRKLADPYDHLRLELTLARAR